MIKVLKWPPKGPRGRGFKTLDVYGGGKLAGPFSRQRFPKTWLSRGDRPGPWLSVGGREPLQMCHRGFHAWLSRRTARNSTLDTPSLRSESDASVWQFEVQYVEALKKTNYGYGKKVCARYLRFMRRI